MIESTRIGAFERIIFRVSRGTAFVRYHELEFELENPQTVRAVQKPLGDARPIISMTKLTRNEINLTFSSCMFSSVEFPLCME